MANFFMQTSFRVFFFVAPLNNIENHSITHFKLFLRIFQSQSLLDLALDGCFLVIGRNEYRNPRSISGLGTRNIRVPERLSHNKEMFSLS